MSGQTRRSAMLGGAAAAIVIAAGAIYEFPRLVARKLKGPYGDLVAKLAEPKRAALLGRSVLYGNAGLLSESPEAMSQQLAQKPLAQIVADDVVRGSLIEAQGWILPQSLGVLCAMAAKTV